MSDAKTPWELLEEACAETGYTLAEMRGRGRKKRMVAARRHVCLRLRGHGFSFQEIGGMLDRDHTTIMWLCKDHGEPVRTRLRVVA